METKKGHLKSEYKKKTVEIYFKHNEDGIIE